MRDILLAGSAMAMLGAMALAIIGFVEDYWRTPRG